MTTINTSSSAKPSRRVTPISSISITAKKSLESVTLFINNQSSDVDWERSDERTFQSTFSPSLDLPESSSDHITLDLHYHYHLGRLSLKRKIQHIDIKISDLVSLSEHDNEEGREWKSSYDGADIVFHFSSRPILQDVTGYGLRQENDSPDRNSKLQTTTQGVIQTCPRFRVLVIGKSGVGKSSLINIAFGTNQASVAHGKAGVSDINYEIIPPDNEYFVLHDSQGFEHGEENNFEIVKKFIESRNAMPDIKDKIHVIWLCFGIPRAGGRILETGIEKFLQLETETPMIAVFTKYDLLMSRMKRDHGKADTPAIDGKKKAETGGSETSAKVAKMKADADAIVAEECVKPLREAAGQEVPTMAISTRNGYEYTVSNLVKLTQELVREQFPMATSVVPVVSAIAQRVNPGVKIEGCIEVGRMKYWKGLASSTNFVGKALETCLYVIHGDIVRVWNFEDPHMHLCSKEFKGLITNLVDDLSQNNAANPNRTISVGMSMVGTIAGIVSALGGPAAPIVMPIAGCFVIAKWVYDVYQQSHDTLRRLMAYIVDLTLIMQNVFWLVSIYHVPVSRRLVKLAYVAYRESIVKVNVHEDIKKHVEGQNIIDRLRRDSALDKIVELLNRNRIDTEEMFRLRGDMGNIKFSGKDDESWVI